MFTPHQGQNCVLIASICMLEDSWLYSIYSISLSQKKRSLRKELISSYCRDQRCPPCLHWPLHHSFQNQENLRCRSQSPQLYINEPEAPANTFLAGGELNSSFRWIGDEAAWGVNPKVLALDGHFEENRRDHCRTQWCLCSSSKWTHLRANSSLQWRWCDRRLAPGNHKKYYGMYKQGAWKILWLRLGDRWRAGFGCKTLGYSWGKGLHSACWNAWSLASGGRRRFSTLFCPVRNIPWIDPR